MNKKANLADVRSLTRPTRKVWKSLPASTNSEKIKVKYLQFKSWNNKGVFIFLDFVLLTDWNNFEDSYLLVKHFTLWECRIATFNQKLLIKGNNSVLPERDLQKMFY